MEYSAFEEATVPICSFVLKNGRATEKTLCFRLSDFKGGMEVQKQKVLEAISDKNCGYLYGTEQSEFSKIPGSPVAYWVSEQLRKCFEFGLPLGKLAAPRQGMATTNNNLFLRQWYEVSASNIGFKYKNLEQTKDGRHRWFPYNKGGQFRKWYGNQDYVVNWYKDGKDLKEYTKDAPGGRMNNMEFYFHPSVTWSKISSGNFSTRFMPQGFIFDVAGCSIFSNEEEKLKYFLGFTNSCVVKYILSAISPTLNYEVEHIKKLPIVFNKSEEVKMLIDDLICNSKNDWDSFETSWDFKKHPFVSYATNKVSISFEMWSKECNERFKQLKTNEEELNRIFIDIYGLQDELTPKVEDKDVTVRQADLQRDIKSLISYAVGCMFGRYSLDEDGLAYAGGEWDNSKYDTFIPDEDNCIPITDEEYFEDDIVGLFCAWLKKVYGEDTLEENLDFISKALGNKGKTNREVIRNYFLTDFIKDHIKTYQKRPIYWLFDSGKQNGFKALVYMHRWNADTIGNVRVEYLHRIQRVYEKEIIRMQEIIDNSHDNKEISNATKRKEKLQKQIKETKDYDAKIAHLALSRIDIDLDDGVKVNYEKVQTADEKKMQILAKI